MTTPTETAADRILNDFLGDELELAAFPYPPRVPFIGEHAVAFAASVCHEVLGATTRPGQVCS